MKKPTILLDMDCVLADFVGGALMAHGLTWDRVLPHWPAGQYGMTPVWGAALGHPHTEAFTDADFWAPIHADPGFWHRLLRLPWAEVLLKWVRTETDDWYVVTSPSWCPGCVYGKQVWLNTLVHGDPLEWCDRLIPTPHKHLLAGPGRILVDDHAGNCERFIKAGGRAVLFPCHHNPLHELKDDPLPHVLDVLRHHTRDPQ